MGLRIFPLLALLALCFLSLTLLLFFSRSLFSSESSLSSILKPLFFFRLVYLFLAGSFRLPFLTLQLRLPLSFLFFLNLDLC
jgi:hypothetical protein